MDKFIISGGRPLTGTISVSGAKNAGYKLMIASLLTEDENIFLNVTDIGDVEIVCDIITYLGGTVNKYGDRAYRLNAKNISTAAIPEQFGEKSRASLLFAGPFLARFKKASLPLPGGDRIGFSRDIDRHLEGLEEFGVSISCEGNFLQLATKGLKACTYTFRKPSHTATENLIITAVLAEGTTILHNCGLEPEIDDLIKYLNSCGAKIRRVKDRTIEIIGVSALQGKTHRITSDRNQVVTYALAAIMTRGNIVIEDAVADHLTSFLAQLEKANGGYEIGDYGMRFFYKGAIHPTDVITQPHPGFMTDWQPLWATFMTQATGKSTIVETIYDNRFQYVEILNKAGANIQYFDPKPADPDVYYHFNVVADRSYATQGIAITGPTPLRPLSVPVWDIRYGATLLLASLITSGESELRDIYHIDRGYDQIDMKMNLLGADIRRIKENK